MVLRAKFHLIVAMASIGLLTLSGCWLRSERSGLLSEKREQARNLVSTAYSIIDLQYRLEKTGSITRAEAQRRAIEIIAAIRYDGDNYYWINDMHPAMVMHPTKPQLNGVDLTAYRDPSGKALFVEMVETVRNSGQGFVQYQWPKPGKATRESVAKLSFVRGFEPWDGSSGPASTSTTSAPRGGQAQQRRRGSD
jgi:methyl-accepting chemotaxis protein